VMATAMQALATAQGKGVVTTGGVGDLPVSTTPVGQWVTSGQVQTFLDALGATATRVVGQGVDAAVIQGINGATFSGGTASQFVRDNAATNTAAVVQQAGATGISLTNADALAGFTQGTLAALAGSGTVAGYSAADVRGYVNAMLAANNPRAIYSRATAEGITSATLDAIMGWAQGTALRWALDNGLPAFGAGGSFAGGLALVGERGPEIVNTGPSRIYSFDQIVAGLGGAGRDEALVAEVQALRAELRALREQTGAEQRAIAANTGATARSLKRWDGDGMPETRAAV